MRNKRGGIGLIMFFFVLMTIVILGFIAAMAFGVIDFASDTVTPIITELGMAGDTNVSEAAEYSVRKLSPFPAFPSEVKLNELWVDIPIVFSSQNHS